MVHLMDPLFQLTHPVSGATSALFLTHIGYFNSRTRVGCNMGGPHSGRVHLAFNSRTHTGYDWDIHGLRGC